MKRLLAVATASLAAADAAAMRHGSDGHPSVADPCAAVSAADRTEAIGTVTVTPSCEQVGSVGAAACFTGAVRIDSHFQTPPPARIGGATVTFAPGARTAWHSHPLGQTLLVVAGVGLVQQWGEPARTIRAGDHVWIPPDTKHWHGATTASAMVHLALAEAENGTAVEWLEPVSASQYNVALASPA